MYGKCVSKWRPGWTVAAGGFGFGARAEARIFFEHLGKYGKYGKRAQLSEQAWLPGCLAGCLPACLHACLALAALNVEPWAAHSMHFLTSATH